MVLACVCSALCGPRSHPRSAPLVETWQVPSRNSISFSKPRLSLTHTRDEGALVHGDAPLPSGPPGHPVEKGKKGKRFSPHRNLQPGRTRGLSRVASHERSRTGARATGGEAQHLRAWDPHLTFIEKHVLNFSGVHFGELVTSTDSGLRPGFRTCLHRHWECAGQGWGRGVEGWAEGPVLPMGKSWGSRSR